MDDRGLSIIGVAAITVGETILISILLYKLFLCTYFSFLILIFK